MLTECPFSVSWVVFYSEGKGKDVKTSPLILHVNIDVVLVLVRGTRDQYHRDRYWFGGPGYPQRHPMVPVLTTCDGERLSPKLDVFVHCFEMFEL